MQLSLQQSQQQRPQRNFQLERRLEQLARNKALKEKQKQKENNKLFWKVIKEQVTKEVARMHLEGDGLRNNLARYGRTAKRDPKGSFAQPGMFFTSASSSQSPAKEAGPALSKAAASSVMGSTCKSPASVLQSESSVIECPQAPMLQTSTRLLSPTSEFKLNLPRDLLKSEQIS